MHGVWAPSACHPGWLTLLGLTSPACPSLDVIPAPGAVQLRVMGFAGYREHPSGCPQKTLTVRAVPAAPGQADIGWSHISPTEFGGMAWVGLREVAAADRWRDVPELRPLHGSCAIWCVPAHCLLSPGFCDLCKVYLIFPGFPWWEQGWGCSGSVKADELGWGLCASPLILPVPGSGTHADTQSKSAEIKPSTKCRVTYLGKPRFCSDLVPYSPDKSSSVSSAAARS